MKLKTVTFTGADDKTDLSELEKISNKYPFVEWGFLISKTKMGTQRYPSAKTIEKLTCPSVHLRGGGNAAHICGEICRQIIADGGIREWSDHPILSRMLSVSDRVQLNFNAKICDIDLVNLFGFIKKTSFTSFILQQNENNASFINAIVPYIQRSKKINILFDCSGGNGSEIAEIPQLIPNIFCGYAGGLSPENLERKLQEIEAVVGDNEIWIDMESGVRTNNEFDLEKVVQCCEIAKKYV